MADRDMEQDDPRLVAAARHALHDEEVVAAFAVDGDAADEADRARALIERCVTCRDLHADMVSIGATIRAAGTAEAIAAVRSAPRDYRLSASDAIRLRGGNVLQRVAARFTDGIASFGRPLGASIAALGLVGLLVGTAMTSVGSPGAMSIEGGDTGAPATAPSFELTAGNNDHGTPPGGAAFGPLASGRDNGSKGATPDDARNTGPAALTLLFAASIALLVFGVGLLLVGSRRRRRATRHRGTRT